jgi:hypothetical protein
MPLKIRGTLSLVLEEKPNLEQIYSLVGKPYYVNQVSYAVALSRCNSLIKINNLQALYEYVKKGSNKPGILVQLW